MLKMEGATDLVAPISSWTDLYIKKNSFSRKSLTFPGEKNFYLRRKITINHLSEVLFKKGYPNRMVTIIVIIIIIIIIIITMIIMVV